MKKLFYFFAILTIFGLTFSSCEKEEKAAATAKVEVKQSGQAKAGVTVYMFKNLKGPSTNFFKPLHADRQSVTESDGIATFELKETFDLEIIDTQTTLHFGVFQNDVVLGQTSLTIKKGETKTVTIAY